MSLQGKQTINIGLPNEQEGSDNLYVAFNKIKDNFDVVFACASSSTTFVAGTGIEIDEDSGNATITITNTNNANTATVITYIEENGLISLVNTDGDIEYAGLTYSSTDATLTSVIDPAGDTNTLRAEMSVSAGTVSLLSNLESLSGNSFGNVEINPGSVSITVSDGVESPAEYTFDQSGITFSDSSVQNTAWPGYLTILDYDQEVTNRVEVNGANVRVRLNTQLNGDLQLDWQFQKNTGVFSLPQSQNYQDPYVAKINSDYSIKLTAGAQEFVLGDTGVVALPNDSIFYKPGSDFNISTTVTYSDPSPTLWVIANEGTSDTPIFFVSWATLSEFGPNFEFWLSPTHPGELSVKGPGISDGDTFVPVVTSQTVGESATDGVYFIIGSGNVFTNGETYTFQFTEEVYDEGDIKNWTFGTDGSLTLPGALVLPTEGLTDGTPASPTALSLDKQVQILSGAENEGFYSLANGVQGQVMYFTPVNSGVYVIVANARIRNTGTGAVEIVTDYSWQVDYDAANEAPRTIAMAIFVNGAWNLTGGATD